MAEQEILKQVAQDFKVIVPKIVDAEDLIKALRDAGEDTVKMDADLRVLKQRRDKWERMLRGRGLL